MTTWTPAVNPASAWSEVGAPLVRVFSPYVFSLRPVFDTGTTQGIWIKTSAPAPSWVAE